MPSCLQYFSLTLLLKFFFFPHACSVSCLWLWSAVFCHFPAGAKQVSHCTTILDPISSLFLCLLLTALLQLIHAQNFSSLSFLCAMQALFSPDHWIQFVRGQRSLGVWIILKYGFMLSYLIKRLILVLGYQPSPLWTQEYFFKMFLETLCSRSEDDLILGKREETKLPPQKIWCTLKQL